MAVPAGHRPLFFSVDWNTLQQVAANNGFQEARLSMVSVVDEAVAIGTPSHL
jgi:hypothetical protein